MQKKKILFNFGYLTLGKIIADIFTFCLFVLISRNFGQEGIGNYSFAMAITGFFLVLANFGLYNLSVKDMSRMKGTISGYFGAIVSLRLLFSLLMTILLLLFIFIFSFKSELRWIILILGFYQIAYAFLDGNLAVFVAHEDMHISSIFDCALKLSIAISSIFIMLVTRNIVLTLIVYPLMTCIAGFYAFCLVKKKYGDIKLDYSVAIMWPLFKEALPFAASSFLFPLSSRMDVVFLGVFLGASAAGVYNVAYRIVFLLSFVALYSSTAIFPHVSKTYMVDRKKLIEIYNCILNAIILVAVPMTLGVWIISEDLIRLIFGPEFMQSVLILKILSFLIIISFFKCIIGVFLTATEKQKTRAQFEWLTAMLNILGTIILIKVMGVPGAAISSVFCELILICCFVFYISKELGFPQVAKRILQACFASALFIVFLTVCDIAIFLALPIAIVIYISTIMLFPDVRNTEFAMIKTMFTD